MLTQANICLRFLGCYCNCRAEAEKVKNWVRMEVSLRATQSNANCRLQFTTSQTGTIWLDQVSAMPTDTYKVENSISIRPNCRLPLSFFSQMIQVIIFGVLFAKS